MSGTTPSERLLARIREDPEYQAVEEKVGRGELVFPGTVIRRTYAGYWQRAQGSWSWFAERPDGVARVGSHYPVTQLLRSPRLAYSVSVTGDVEIDPAGR